MNDSTIARVTLTIDIAVGDSWGTGCTLEQVHSQAVESATRMIARRLNSEDFRIVGNPKVETIRTLIGN